METGCLIHKTTQKVVTLAHEQWAVQDCKMKALQKCTITQTASSRSSLQPSMDAGKMQKNTVKVLICRTDLASADWLCAVVIQFACEDTLDPSGKFRSSDGKYAGAPRDGIPRDSDDDATDTIPDNQQSAVADTVENRRFGMHESFDYYQKCKSRERNKGLFAADQNLRRNDARATRQNPNGNRHGFECPEEVCV